MVILEELGCGQEDKHASTILGNSKLLTNIGISMDYIPCDDFVNGTMILYSLEESLPHAKTHNELTFSTNEITSPS